MQFESQQKRNWWINNFLGLLPDVAIALALSHFMQFSGWGIIVTVFVLNLIYFFVWGRNTIWQWIFYKWRGKDQLVEHLYNYLKTNNYPCPNDFETSAESYLAFVAESEKSPIQTRLLAAKELGALSYPASTFRVQEGMRLSMAYEEAIKRYKEYCERTPEAIV
jgi:hypothetical protein